MKILFANRFYYHRGGADVYHINLEQFLQNKNHDVATFAMQHPQNIGSAYSSYFPKYVEYGSIDLRQFFSLISRPLGTREVKHKFNALLDNFQPDVVHFNNIHTHLSPVIAQIAHKRGIKTVWTIHDSKLLCPRLDCTRNKKTCELCFTNKINVLKYRCLKNSLPASIIAYLEAIKWSREKLENCTDIFICPSQFMANNMQKGGFNINKILTLCNFIDIEKTRRENYDKEDYYCYLGRLSNEKGIYTLIEAAKQLPFKLKLIGGGPLLEKLQQSTNNETVEILGHKNWDEIKNIVGKARFSVLPSECNENNPLSVIESKCLGTPVLGANIGGIPELIEPGKTGMLFESRNAEDLKEKIVQMFSADFDYMQIATESQNRYSAEKYYQELMKIYGKENQEMK